MDRVAKITIAKCMKTGREFSIRLEQTTQDRWEATWASKIPATRVRNESTMSRRADEIKISGLTFSPTYPGCPHCQGTIIVPCPNPGCRKLYCHDMGQGLQSRCPWCGTRGLLVTKGPETDPGDPNRTTFNVEPDV